MHSHFLLNIINNDLAPKILHGQEHHGAPFGTHTILLLVTAWPGSLLLAYVLPTILQHGRDRAIRFCCAWFFPAWIVFECVHTKLPQYQLPMLPALAVLMSYGVWSTQAAWPRWQLWSATTYRVIWCLVSVGIATALICVDYYLMYYSQVLTWLLAAIIVGTALLATYQETRQQPVKMMITLVAGAVLTFGLIFHSLLPSWHRFWITERVVDTIKAHPELSIDDTSPLYSYGYSEPSLIFRLGTRRVQFVESMTEIPANAHWVMINKTDIKTFQRILKDSNRQVVPIADIEGFHYSKGKWRHFVLLEVNHA